MKDKNTVTKIQFDKYRFLVGLVLAVLTFIFFALRKFYVGGGMLAFAFLLAGSFKIKTKNVFLQYLLFFVWMVAVAIFTVSTPAYTVRAVHHMTVTRDIVYLNYLCVLMVFAFLTALTAKPKLSVVLGSFLLLVLTTINGLVFQFRGREMGYFDFFSIRTAINVAGQYRPDITLEMAVAWLRWVAVMLLALSLPKLNKIPAAPIRIFALLATFLLWAPLNPTTKNIPIKTWESEGTRLNGFYLNMYMSIRDSAMKKPKGYDPKEIEQLAQQYLATDALPEDAKRPNILVIMDESFADFRIFGDLPTNEPVTPFLNDLTQNTIRGYALTSVYGGNTANAEFEFLTGHSMSCFPDFSVPYQQYIHKDMFTLARLMDSYGYKSMSTHPYWDSGWSRNIIYPYFGFEESTFMDAYTTNYPVREYISDRDMFDYILNLLQNKEDERPLFLFGITMQNHGGYDYVGENFEEPLQLSDMKGDYPLATQYLNLLRETDKAMEYLLTSLNDFEEDTIVLFFGDHLPKLETKFYEELYGSNFKTLTEQQLHYTVPFYIWANYDISEKVVPRTSLNFLPVHLLKAADLPLPPYYRYLADVEKQIPAVNTLGYYSVEKKGFLSFEKATEKDRALLDQYASLTYNQLFDKKQKNTLFFH